MHGFFLLHEGGPTEPVIVSGAQMDGLVWIADKNISIAELVRYVSGHGAGHLVALLISQRDESVDWKGDYHWVRCDETNCISWSQKDGTDQVTNFDFAGNIIEDPRNAVWEVNQGPRSKTDPADFIVNYEFCGFMFVPIGKVKII
jgi:hypothetical protein